MTKTRFLLAFGLGAALCAAALAKPKDTPMFQTPSDYQAPSRKKAAGPDVHEFGSDKKAPEKPFPWAALVGGLVICGGTFWLLMAVYRNWAAEHFAEDGAAPGESAPTAEAQAALEPKDRVLGVVQRAESWVSPGRVATTAKVDLSEASALLEELAGEGLLEMGKDREGRMMFRAAQA